MAGELVIRKGGYFSVEDNADAEDKGAGLFFTDKPDECCCCDPCENADPKPYKTLHSWTSNSNDSARRTENLRPYQKKGECFRYWVLFEGNFTFDAKGCLSSKGTTYGSGAIVDGELVGLPDSFTSNYS
jgi:hypothetical protein